MLKTKKSFKAQGNTLMIPENQLNRISSTEEKISFSEQLKQVGKYPLRAVGVDILQVNIGYMCNQTCTHCHVDAGPDRKELMSKDTLQVCLDVLEKSSIKTIDITGGAPEMHPHFEWFLEELGKRNVEIIVRSNLTILVSNKKYDHYPELFRKHNVTIISSLPCYTAENTDKQRGEGVFTDSILALHKLNKTGYGIGGSGLNLHLVYNPGGPSLPPAQSALEQDYKKRLKEDFNIEFNSLYTITNLPVSRFLDYLIAVGKYEEYMQKLIDSFNPSAVDNVMCRNTISVGYDGSLYDCDFNQMLELGVNKKASQTIFDFNESLLKGRNIVVNNHCFGCTAGYGSSCQGALI